MIYPIVLAGQHGGAASEKASTLPSHFLASSGSDSLFQEVLKGLSHPMFAAPTVVTAEAYGFVVSQQMQETGCKGTMMLEPGKPKSAAAIAAMALQFQHDPEAVLLILPADSAGVEADPFHHALEAALPSVFGGNLVLLTGVEDKFARRYGQVKPLSVARPGEPMQALFSLLAMKQKDTRALANTGTYLVRAGSLLAAFKRHAPRLLQATKPAVEGMEVSDNVLRPAARPYDRIRPEAFEAAVLARMEMVVALQTDEINALPLRPLHMTGQQPDKARAA